MKIIPSISIPIIENGESIIKNLFDIMKNKKVIIFGLPGAFTSTCSEKHLPGFLKLSQLIKNKGIDEIYCLSVNDPYVMKSWLLNYPDSRKIKCIADGNCEFSKLIDVAVNKSSTYMGMRCLRFAAIIKDSRIEKFFIENSGELKVSSAEYIIQQI
mgnify:CR=1 FL=1